MWASKKKSLTVLTFELHVLHSALRQRVEGVPREVGGRVKHVGLPLLQDVLQQLVQDITCGDAKVRGHHNGNAATPRRVFSPAENWEFIVGVIQRIWFPFFFL